MKTLGYYNGKFGEIEEMVVPMADRGGYFGDGVYDATCSRNYKMFALDEHIDRFFNSAALLKIKIHYTKQEIADILNEMVKKMDTGENLVYWQFTRGTALRNHVFPEGPGNLWIMLRPSDINDGTEPISLIPLFLNTETLNVYLLFLNCAKALQEVKFFAPTER